MELFVFGTPQSAPIVPTNLQNASAISGYLNASWIERYRDNGEFEITAKLSSGLRNKLPIGSLISHLKTFEVMVVEDHTIKDKDDKDSEVTITGRSLEAVLLENRTVGESLAFTLASGRYFRDYTDYVMASAAFGLQLSTMILNHIGPISGGDPYALDPDGRVEDITSDYITRIVPTNVERVIDRGPLYPKLVELMASEDYGIRIVRKHQFPSKFTGGNSDTKTVLRIHDGEDKSSEVIFSAENGEITAADYLWSNRKLKTSVIVTGQYLEVRYTVPGTGTGYERRTMHITASDLDRDYEPGVSSTGVRDAIVAKMEQRGKEALASQKDIALVAASVSKNPNPKFKYRENYDIGDIVMVRGSYGESSQMRVVEYAEFDDKEKSVGYPTLAKL
jgi:hypothetical protein